MSSPLRIFLGDRSADDREALRRRLAGGPFDLVDGEALADAVLTTPNRRPAHEPVVEALTPRERDVLALLAEGMPNRAIAQVLGISDHTVKFHLGSIFGKLGAATRTEAVQRGLRLGVIDL